jgi:hypothetical protein
MNLWLTDRMQAYLEVVYMVSLQCSAEREVLIRE